MSELHDDFARQPGDHRTELLNRLKSEKQRSAAVMQPRQSGDTAPLSFSQESLWFLDQFAPGQSTYNVPGAFRIGGDLDVEAFRAAFADVVGRHESMRTSLHDRDGEGLQRIHATVPVEVPVIEPAGSTADERLAAARKLATDAAREPFDLTAAPLWRVMLYRIDEGDHLLVLVVHHVIWDGWSMGVFCQELAAFYGIRTGVEGIEAPEPPALQYADYATWQRDWLQGKVLEELNGYWRDRLTGAPVVEFPTDRPRPAEATFDGATLHHSTPIDLMEDLHGLARETGTSTFAVYLAAFLIVLHRHTGQEDLTVGSAAANRSRTEVERMIGYFINILVLRTDLSGDPTVRQLIGRVHDVVQGAMAHGELPFDRVVDVVRPPRDPARTPLFQIGFGLSNLAEPPRLPGLTVVPESPDLDTARFDMTWGLMETTDGLIFTLEYNTNLFDADTMNALAGHYKQALRALIPFLNTPISRVPVITPAEREELLTKWNGPTRPNATTTLPQEFELQVERDPAAVAVVVGGTEMTYGELNGRANRLARLLAENGVERGGRVALAMPRDHDLIVSMFATLKAGAAYVPIDSSHPPQRVAGMLADAAPAVVLSHSSVAGNLPEGGPKVLVLDELADTLAGYDDTNLDYGPGLKDVAYVLFTSGTTGRPKGVLIEHHSVVEFVDAISEMFDIVPSDRIVAFASLTFDVSVFEIFTALCRGARINLVRDEERLDMEALQKLIEETRTTIIDLPPPVMALLTPERFTAARLVMVGGEMFNGELVNRWNRRRRLFNGYGPTECTVAMVYYECIGHFESGPPIGLPYANHVAHVVDQHMELLPYGVAGELVIGGVGLTPGYLNDPFLTQAKIVHDPFGTAQGGRLYHTGDLVKRLRNGNLLCLGRIDAQVKIRGQRIELGEIETVLASHPDVGQVSVQAWTDEVGEKHLVAYVSSAAGTSPEVTLLRGYVSEHLPRHMVPAYVVLLEQLPLTVAGKVDARRLPAPDESARTGGVSAEPTNETERVLAEEIFAPLLRLSKVGIHDNFFEIGGNSLQATQLVSRIRDRFGVDLGLAEFFRSPTVAHLGGVVDAQKQESMSDEELLALLEQMPEDEVAKLLGDQEGDGSA
ncbi:amino acid adenylation domain-containing protein [Sphaerisporangium sp. NPDC051011]|uniref:non-ribosomal peptide synthetase n=1 Tax=Sphaerisporangium sp. NPDC051011 TaxID=3155792 RepID=UPI0033F1AA65